jgi:hypothetical protein
MGGWPACVGLFAAASLVTLILGLTATAERDKMEA